LKYLGLRDSEIADEIAKTIANADILDQLDTLDLSLGTLTDVGAKAFLSSEKIKNLKKLDLHYHFMSPDMVKQLRKTGVTINAEDPQEADKDSDGTIYRYPQVTE
jgi:urease alpha subunit